MTTPEKNIPRALREVWAWKDAIYQDVKHLPRDQMLRAMLDNAHKAALELGMTYGQPGRAAKVAESPATYGGSRGAHRRSVS